MATPMVSAPRDAAATSAPVTTMTHANTIDINSSSSSSNNDDDDVAMESEDDGSASPPYSSSSNEDDNDDNDDAKPPATASVVAPPPPPSATIVGRSFYATLVAGQQVDVFCISTKLWLPAKIELVATDNKAFHVHYMGWNKSSDEVIDTAARIAPRGSNATTLWAEIDARMERRKRPRDPEATPAKPAVAMGEIDPEMEPTFVVAGATRSGRKITKRVEHNALPVRRATPAKAAAPTSASGATTNAADAPVAISTAATVEDAPQDFLEDDLCATCGQIEDDELSKMILCDGGCLSSFHFSCLGLEEAPTDDPWLCEQCRTNEHVCFLCGRNGTMNEKGGVFRCSTTTCGKFYHQRCISSSKLARRYGRAAALEAAAATTDATSSDAAAVTDGESSAYELETAAFRCPRHVCAVCEDSKKGSDLMCCLQCPESYHPQCVPPSARYNSVGLLCARHPLEKLPKIPAFYYNDPRVDAITVDSNLRLPPLFLPKLNPDASNRDDPHHFRLLLTLVDDVRQKAPPYKKLARSIYTFKKPPASESLDDAPMCVCTTHCGDDCINRLSFTECYGPAPVPGTTKFTKLTRESNCRLGDECGNRALHQKLYPRFEKFYSQDKGWGLRILEPVKAGQLVIEYVGEVVNEQEKERRLQDHARLTPEDKNMYIMELSKGVYIDARFKGSVSRYINHACAPNCHLLKWHVRGENRIAITALTDIAAGDELSYDYQFHTQQAIEWKCHCRAPTCRGTMAPEKLAGSGHSEPTKKLTKKEQLERMKRARKQEKIQQEREGKSSARRQSLTSQLCGFGDTGGKSLVRVGPATRELAWVRHNRVFLARTARRGFDFLRRKALKDRKLKGKRMTTTTATAVTTKVKHENGKNELTLSPPAFDVTGSHVNGDTKDEDVDMAMEATASTAPEQATASTAPEPETTTPMTEVSATMH